MIRLVFGCGFLGLPTARGWSLAGDQVYALTRDRNRFLELERNGIQPLIGDIVDPASLPDLPRADTVLVAVGMDRTKYSDIRAVYVEGLRNILDQISDETGHVIYISSTGVYGSFDGEWIDEDSPAQPNREGGKACLEAEQLLKQSRFSDRYTILRFAGLYGGRRVPMKEAIANRQWDKLVPEGSLNLIHVKDGANIIRAIADRRPFGETFLVSDGHPCLRKDFYLAVARHLNAGPIEWPKVGSRPTGSDKKISNRKLLETIEFEFAYPDYQAGLGEAFTQSVNGL
jgi:nucleoside-diphosphate-sugar epimerase